MIDLDQLQRNKHAADLAVEYMKIRVSPENANFTTLEEMTGLRNFIAWLTEKTRKESQDNG